MVEKRWLVFLLLVILITGMFSSTVLAEEIELTMSAFGMAWENKLYTEFAIPEFEKENPNINVTFVRYEDYWNKILVRHAGGKAPDVMRNSDEYMGTMIINDGLYPLTDYIQDPSEELDLNDYHEKAIDALTMDGEIWALPQDLSPKTALFYNKTLFDEVGIDYPDEKWTIEDMVNAAQKLTKGERPRVEQYGLSWADHYYPISLIFGLGGHLWSEDEKSCDINNPKNVEGIKFIRKMIYDYKIAPTYAERATDEALNLFKSGRLAMFIGGGWNTPSVKRDAPNLKFGVASIPLAPSGRTTILGQCTWTMSSQTKYPDAAWKLIKYLSSKEALKAYWQKTWVAAPARLSLVNGAEFENITGIEGFVPSIDSEEEIEDLISWYRYVINNNQFITDHLHPYFDILTHQFLTPAFDSLFGLRPTDNIEAVLQDVEDKVNNAIKNSDPIWRD